MIRHQTLLLSLLATSTAFAQGDAPVVIKGAFDRFTTDELGNVYALRGDELKLFSPEGKQLARNSVKTFGEITCIDAFSSLRPMVFSRSMGQLAVLDNTLSVQADVIDLPRNGFPQVTLACSSVQNAFWFFDERALQLTRVDAQLRTLATTGRLDQLLGITPHPVQMQELDGWLYVCDPEQGVLVFDVFGAYAKTLPIVGTKSVEVRGGSVFYVKDGALQRYDMKSFEITPIVWPVSLKDLKVIDARIDRGDLFCLTEEGIVVEVMK